MSFFAAPAATTTTSTTASADKDVEMGDPPTDSISSMAFSPQADYLSVGSWDNSVCSRFLACAMACQVFTFDRFESTKLVREDNRRERPCISIRARY